MHIMKLHEPPNILESSIFIKVIQFFLACLYYMYIRPFFKSETTIPSQERVKRLWQDPGDRRAAWGLNGLVVSIYIYASVVCKPQA